MRDPRCSYERSFARKHIPKCFFQQLLQHLAMMQEDTSEDGSSVTKAVERIPRDKIPNRIGVWKCFCKMGKKKREVTKSYFGLILRQYCSAGWFWCFVGEKWWRRLGTKNICSSFINLLVSMAGVLLPIPFILYTISKNSRIANIVPYTSLFRNLL